MSELFARTDRLRAFAGIHDRIATDLSQMGGGAPGAAGVQASHGSIAATVDAALSSALNARLGTMQSAADDGSTISELLRKAEQLYEQGDRDGAETLRTAAEELADQRDTPGSQGADRTAGAGESGEDDPTNNQMIGQLLGQVGQQVGALAGAVTAPLLGLAQGLQQVPQQIMQAAQGATTSAAEDPKRRDRKPEDAEKRSEEPEESPEPTRQPDPDDAASSGGATNFDRAPVPPVVAEPPRPAQTRPQVR
nr:type VII secretion target [Mycolicibacterium komanii]CRL68940.1 hypothetical protein CPGR_01315 [Mycolicibacterium komanii]